jgi:hypothetical protein
VTNRTFGLFLRAANGVTFGAAPGVKEIGRITERECQRAPAGIALSPSTALHTPRDRRLSRPILSGFSAYFAGISNGARKGTVAGLTYWNIRAR